MYVCTIQIHSRRRVAVSEAETRLGLGLPLVRGKRGSGTYSLCASLLAEDAPYRMRREPSKTYLTSQGKS